MAHSSGGRLPGRPAGRVLHQPEECASSLFHTNRDTTIGDYAGVTASDCPTGQPRQLGALNFVAEYESCLPLKPYTEANQLDKETTVAFTDYFSGSFLSTHGATTPCPSCGTKSITFNLHKVFSFNPGPMQWDVQGVLAHEFGHMLGFAHMGTDPATCDQTPPPPCAAAPDRNTMGAIPAGDTCERDLSYYDKLNANTIYGNVRDFNGDLKADILWRHDSGGTAMWLMNGLAVVGGDNLPWTDPSWKVGGIGDFNGDSRADILWRNDSGASAIWLMDGVTQIAGANLRSIDPSWKVGGVGDFNGDGKADILWRNDSGANAIWLMDGLAELGGGNLPWTDPSWKVGGIGDFNGDGKADILWRNDSGANAIWLMDGLAQLGGANLPWTDPSWKIGGIGDFNGNSKADILWRNDSGANTVWFMNGLTQVGGVNLPMSDPAWKVAAVGDFNGDGQPDILWRNTISGDVPLWLMNGTSIVTSGVVGTVSLGWQIVPSR
jgi:VCBS repeat protein/FG-GAP repeat protein